MKLLTDSLGAVVVHTIFTLSFPLIQQFPLALARKS